MGEHWRWGGGEKDCNYKYHRDKFGSELRSRYRKLEEISQLGCDFLFFFKDGEDLTCL